MYHPFKWWIAGLVHGRARLLPGTLAHALVVLHDTLPDSHETTQPFLKDTLAVSQPYLSRFSVMYRAFLECTLAVSRPYLSRFWRVSLGVPGFYLGQSPTVGWVEASVE